MDKITSDRIRYVLWTSGWDSTYMILRLLHKGETVQPIYIVNPRRKSRFREIEAMQNLEKLMLQKIKTGKLLPLKQYEKKNIRKNHKIEVARRRLSKKLTADGRRPLGYQYGYLARFAEQHHEEFPVIALGIEKVTLQKAGGLPGAIQLLGSLTKDHRIDAEQSSKDLGLLLNNFEFPIIDMTEPEMVKEVEKWQDTEIMRGIWFCHKPVDGQACGFCSPCFQKVKDEMGFLLPDKAKWRYERFSKIEDRYGRHVKKIAEFFYRLKIGFWGDSR